MPIICWTVFYPGGPSVSHGVTRLAHAAGRRVRPIVHHANLMQHHAAKVTAPSHGWFKLVCKMIPAGLAGGGASLAPHPTVPTQFPAVPPAFVAPGPAVSPPTIFAPGPVVSPGPPPLWNFWPQPPPTPYIGPLPPAIPIVTPPTVVPEPSSAAVLLGGVAGLLLLRLSMQRLAYSSDRIQPTSCQTKLLGSGPVA
jgi:hypothetical protein